MLIYPFMIWSNPISDYIGSTQSIILKTSIYTLNFKTKRKDMKEKEKERTYFVQVIFIDMSWLVCRWEELYYHPTLQTRWFKWVRLAIWFLKYLDQLALISQKLLKRRIRATIYLINLLIYQTLIYKDNLSPGIEKNFFFIYPDMIFFYISESSYLHVITYYIFHTCKKISE